MLFPSETLRQRLMDLQEELAGGDIAPAEAANRLLAVDPDFAKAYGVLAATALEAGDRAEAERLLWKALELQPFGCLNYASLAGFYQRDPRTEAVVETVWLLGLWAAGLSEEVPREFARVVREKSSDRDRDFDDPETYCQLAEAREGPWRGEAMDAALSRRLRPYWLLKELARGVREGPTGETLREIGSEAAACLPVWRAVVRAWARNWGDTHVEVLMLVVALLGEYAGPEVLDDLWELSNRHHHGVFLHAHWALCRMAARFPAEVVANIQAALPAASTGIRCGMAEHLGLMRGVAGVEAALLALVQDFADRAADGDAPYLLMAVGDALAEAGRLPRVKEMFARNERLLPKDGRAWFRETLESEEGFVPHVTAEGLPALSLEEVCLDSALMEQGDDEDEFDEDELDEGENEFDEEEVSHPKPGRNDPCWCGSGKKYKKCHLQSDEAHEAQDPVRSEAMGDLLSTAGRLHKRRAMMAAARQYFDEDISDLPRMEQDSEGFLMWFLFDFRPEPGARTVVEEHLRRHGAHMRAEVREVLEAWRDSRYGLFEVGRSQSGSGRELKDVYAGDTVPVDDDGNLKAGEHVLARIEQWGGKASLSEGTLPVSRHNLPALRAFIQEESGKDGQTEAAFVRANVHRLHRALRDL